MRGVREAGDFSLGDGRKGNTTKEKKKLKGRSKFGKREDAFKVLTEESYGNT